MARIGLPLAAVDTQQALDAMWVIYNRCEEDGVPEPFMEVARSNDNGVQLDVSWYPKIYDHHKGVAALRGQIEQTLGIVLDEDGASNLTYEGPMPSLVDNDNVTFDFTIYT